MEELGNETVKRIREQRLWLRNTTPQLIYELRSYFYTSPL
jgi:hypothetical protein